jgi:hypothetical protein
MLAVKKWTKTDPQSEALLRLIADLGCRRDKILQSPELDLQALAQLLADYEAADLISAGVSNGIGGKKKI